MRNNRQVSKTLSKISRALIGKPMTKKERAFLEILRERVRKGEITIEEAHKIWDSEILGEIQDNEVP